MCEFGISYLVLFLCLVQCWIKAAEIHYGYDKGELLEGKKLEWKVDVPKDHEGKIIVVDVQIINCTLQLTDGNRITNITTDDIGTVWRTNQRVRIMLNCSDSEKFARFFFSYELLELRPSNSRVCRKTMRNGTLSIAKATESDNYPVRCNWVLTASEGNILKLKINTLNIAFSGPNCPIDYLEIFNENNLLIERTCGTRIPWHVISEGPLLFVKLVTNDPSSQFDCSYQEISNFSFSKGMGKYLISLHNMEAEENTLMLHDPTYSFADFFEDFPYNYKWYVNAPHGYCIISNVTIYNYSNDNGELSFYEGPEIASFLQTQTPTLRKGAYNLRLHVSRIFHALININLMKRLNTGTSIQISFQKKLSNEIFYCNGYFSATSVPVTVTLIPVVFAIASPVINGQCMWTFVSRRSNRFLKITFLHIDLSEYENCAYQGLVLYDGEHTTTPDVGPICGQSYKTGNSAHMINQYVSSSQQLTVVFFTLLDYRTQTKVVAHIVEYECKGYLMRNAPLTIDSNQRSCITVQRNPLVARNINIMEDISFVSPVELRRFDIHGINMQGNGCHEKCIEYISVLNLKPFCIHTGSLQFLKSSSPETRVLARAFSHCGWPNANFDLTLDILPERIEENCEKYQPYRITATNFFRLSACGILEGPINAENIYWILTHFQTKSLQCKIENKYPSHYELIVHGFCDKDLYGSLFITERVYFDSCIQGSLSGFEHKISELYNNFCPKEPFGDFPIKTIFADEVKIRYPTSISARLLIEYQVIRQKKHGERLVHLCPNKHDGFYEGKCYSWLHAKNAQPLTWNEARSMCLNIGGDLVALETHKEYEYFMNLLRSKWKRLVYSVSPFVAIYLGLAQKERQDRKWMNGSPLVFSKWYQPGNVAGPYTWNSNHGYVNVMYEVISERKKQPLNSLDTKCTLMVIQNPYVGNSWFSFPCSLALPQSTVICETRSTNCSVCDRNWTSDLAQLSKPKMCLENWTYKNTNCYRLVTSVEDIDKIMTFESAFDFCRRMGGKVANLNTSEVAVLMRAWMMRPEYGPTWLLNVSEAICVVVKGVYGNRLLGDEDRGIHWETREVSCDPANLHGIVPLNVLCARPVDFHKPMRCPGSQHRCSDGSCISFLSICDGFEDCPGGDDELSCSACEEGRFRCGNGRCISGSSLCNFKPDCEDGSDENDCLFPPCAISEFRCLSGQCVNKSHTCDFVVHCTDGTDESDDLCDWTRNCAQYGGFLCFDGKCIAGWHQRNIRVDCTGVAQEDETFTNKDFKRGLVSDGQFSLDFKPVYNYSPYCPSPHQSRCRLDHPSCFERSHACLYEKRISRAGCGDNTHLINCREYECPGFFKCPNSYCLPRHSVCDGEWDCLGGFDEKACERYSCPGAFKCQGTSMCLDQEEVCNGIDDCPGGDDEKLCDLDMQCPKNCSCSGYVLDCHNCALTSLPLGSVTMRTIFYSRNVLLLNNASFKEHRMLRTLDLSFNNITIIPPLLLKDLVNLLHLNLHGNQLKQLSYPVFQGLRLLILNLSSNNLHSISMHAFNGLQNRVSIDLRSNDKFLEIHPKAFENINITQIQTDSFRFCCLVKHRLQEGIQCSPTEDPFSSCSDLISNHFLRSALWAIGFLAFVGNIGVLIGRCKSSLNSVNSVLIITLAFADLLTGVYMIIVASADAYYLYKGQYFLHDPSWRNGLVCRMAGFLAFVSSEMSVSALLLITIDRLISLVFVFKVQPISMRQARIAIVSLVVFWTTIAALPLAPIEYFGSENYFYGATSVCLPFTLTSSNDFSDLKIGVFIVFNFIAFVFIAASYLAIFLQTRISRKASGQKTNDKEVELAKKLSILVFTDFCCWIPVVIAGIMAAGGTAISPQFIAWMAAIILPINAAFNPFLYTLSSVKCKKRGSKPVTFPSTCTS